MDKFKEVKKILFENGVGSERGHIARLICRLFELPDDPDRLGEFAPGADERLLTDIIAEFDRDIQLAPNDNAYLRILVKDTLEQLRTGKNSAQRAHEKYVQAGGK